MIEHVIVYGENLMQSKHLPVRHPEGPVSECPDNVKVALDDGPFILCCEE